MTTATRLRELEFVDLYLGHNYADVKGVPGSNAARTPVPDCLHDDLGTVRAKCAELSAANDEPEFALPHDGVLYRVTVMQDLYSKPIYFLRRMTAQVRDFTQLGLPASLTNYLMATATRGLILFAGDMASGKTTSAASLLATRLRAHGGLALAIEDPPETQLDGTHGEGRCIQIPALRKHGHYREQLRRAMRTGVSTLLIGEIRCKDTAVEAIKQSINGLTVISTIHASSAVDAVTRINSLAGTDDISNPHEVLAGGLAGIVHQQINRVERPGLPTNVRLAFKALTLDGKDADGIRTKIRRATYEQLAQDVENQSRLNIWNHDK